MMDERSSCRAILFQRANKFYEYRVQSKLNINDSPMLQNVLISLMYV